VIFVPSISKAPHVSWNKIVSRDMYAAQTPKASAIAADAPIGWGGATCGAISSPCRRQQIRLQSPGTPVLSLVPLSSSCGQPFSASYGSHCLRQREPCEKGPALPGIASLSHVVPHFRSSRERTSKLRLGEREEGSSSLSIQANAWAREQPQITCGSVVYHWPRRLKEVCTKF
jgi:hypothetical protein